MCFPCFLKISSSAMSEFGSALVDSAEEVVGHFMMITRRKYHLYGCATFLTKKSREVVRN